MPGFGLGVYKVDDGDIVVESVKTAINHGYRSIDTASFYDNETGVGKGIKASGVAREDIFVTSKVWNDEQGYESTLQAFERSLKKLDLEYLDLYLIHWPIKDLYKETWKALEKLYKDNRVRAIGVSNFNVNQLKDLLADCNIKPVINQVEFHPHLTQLELRDLCKQEHIQLEAWSPLKRGKLLEEPTILEIARKYQKSAAQVILRWDLQNNVITIPKSVTKERIIENADIFNFRLTDEDMNSLNGLNINERCGSDPASYE
jgi:diketogulonate reductase-like aldo/keto reductase